MKILALAFLSVAVMLADVTGNWSGALSMTGPGGETQSQPILLILKQEGAKVTGTGGRDENDRHAVLEGKADNGKIVLEVEAGSSPVRLELALSGDELNGEASRTRGDGSKQTAKVAVKRVK